MGTVATGAELWDAGGRQGRGSASRRTPAVGARLAGGIRARSHSGRDRSSSTRRRGRTRASSSASVGRTGGCGGRCRAPPCCSSPLSSPAAWRSRRAARQRWPLRISASRRSLRHRSAAARIGSRCRGPSRCRAAAPRGRTIRAHAQRCSAASTAAGGLVSTAGVQGRRPRGRHAHSGHPDGSDGHRSPPDDGEDASGGSVAIIDIDTWTVVKEFDVDLPPLATQFRRDVLVSGDGRSPSSRRAPSARRRIRDLLRQLAELHRPDDGRAACRVPAAEPATRRLPVLSRPAMRGVPDPPVTGDLIAIDTHTGAVHADIPHPPTSTRASTACDRVSMSARTDGCCSAITGGGSYDPETLLPLAGFPFARVHGGVRARRRRRAAC